MIKTYSELPNKVSAVVSPPSQSGAIPAVSGGFSGGNCKYCGRECGELIDGAGSKCALKYGRRKGVYTATYLHKHLLESDRSKQTILNTVNELQKDNADKRSDENKELVDEEVRSVIKGQPTIYKKFDEEVLDEVRTESEELIEEAVEIDLKATLAAIDNDELVFTEKEPETFGEFKIAERNRLIEEELAKALDKRTPEERAEAADNLAREAALAKESEEMAAELEAETESAEAVESIPVSSKEVEKSSTNKKGHSTTTTGTKNSDGTMSISSLTLDSNGSVLKEVITRAKFNDEGKLVTEVTTGKADGTTKKDITTDLGNGNSETKSVIKDKTGNELSTTESATIDLSKKNLGSR